MTNATQIITIDADYFQAGVASIHMLVNQGHAAFVDTGTNTSIDNVKQAMQAQQISAEQVDWVILTHIHLDHAGGASQMMREFPNAQLVVHPFGSRHMANPEKLIAGTEAVYGKDKARQIYGEIVPIDAGRIVETADAMVIDFQGEHLHFYDTPGHAKHHHCVYLPANGACFTGDTLGLAYPDLTNSDTGTPYLMPTTTPVQFSPQDMHQSIDKVMALRPEKLFLTHFGPITPTTELIAKLHEQVDDFVLLAQRSNEQPQAQQEHWLTQELHEYTLRRAIDNNPQLDADSARQLLAMDAKLSAQGLIFWMQRYGG